jgi:hypothetical protein
VNITILAKAQNETPASLVVQSHSLNSQLLCLDTVRLRQSNTREMRPPSINLFGSGEG